MSVSKEPGRASDRVVRTNGEVRLTGLRPFTAEDEERHAVMSNAPLSSFLYVARRERGASDYELYPSKQQAELALSTCRAWLSAGYAEARTFDPQTGESIHVYYAEDE